MKLKLQKNQKGIAHIGVIILAVFVIAAVGVVGWKVSSSTKKTAINVSTTCVPPTVFPSAPNGGLTYVNWTFASSTLSSITNQISLNNNPGNTTEMYLQLYDANIDNTGQYFGLQTSGLVLWSQFGTNNTADVVAGPGSTVVVGNNEGAYISLRHNFGSLPAGDYQTEVYRTSASNGGDWFSFYVTFPRSRSTYIGEMWFPRANASVAASFHSGGGTWIEDYQNNGSTLYPVPLWNVSTYITGNGKSATHAVSNYSAMPNSDIYEQGNSHVVTQIAGGATPRCHPAGSLW